MEGFCCDCAIKTVFQLVDGITSTVAAGSRLALQLILEKGLKFYSFQLQDMDALYCYFLSLPPCVRMLCLQSLQLSQELHQLDSSRPHRLPSTAHGKGEPLLVRMESRLVTSLQKVKSSAKLA
jgi:hypothetical protein